MGAVEIAVDCGRGPGVRARDSGMTGRNDVLLLSRPAGVSVVSSALPRARARAAPHGRLLGFDRQLSQRMMGYSGRGLIVSVFGSIVQVVRSRGSRSPAPETPFAQEAGIALSARGSSGARVVAGRGEAEVTPGGAALTIGPRHRDQRGRIRTARPRPGFWCRELKASRRLEELGRHRGRRIVPALEPRKCRRLRAPATGRQAPGRACCGAAGLNRDQVWRGFRAEPRELIRQGRGAGRRKIILATRAGKP